MARLSSLSLGMSTLMHHDFAELKFQGSVDGETQG